MVPLEMLIDAEQYEETFEPTNVNAPRAFEKGRALHEIIQASQ